jgi:putative restriction endonuclease
MPFFFKLKAPHHAIAGFGFFAGFSVLPDWLAWDTFGDANGVPSLSALRERLAGIQDGARISADPGGRIGCCLIAEARFFPREAWVVPPRDWSPRIQSGAGYDLEAGEGARVWRDCLERSQQRVDSELVYRPHDSSPPPRHGTPVLHTPRLGQGIFRNRVLDAYGRACAVTQEHSLPVVEAAHIKPFADGGEHAVTNGLALRADIHRLFDRGYVTVDEDSRFVVSRRLKDEFENGRSYYRFQGQSLELPSGAEARPEADALRWHREEVFLG